MKSPCPRYIERLVALAEGQSDVAVEVHVAGCAGCSAALTQYRTILAAAKRESFPVPTSLSVMAMSIMPATRRTLVARLLRSSALAGARNLPGDLQISIDVDGHAVRVMYARQERGWDVLSTVPGPEWFATHGESNLHTDPSGRFSFNATRADATGFRLATSEVAVEVPPMEELLSGRTGTD